MSELAPGLALSAAIAVVAYTLAPLVGRVAPIPALVIALIIGIALNPLGVRPQFTPGIKFCVKVLLRCAVALLGLRIALGDIAALGLGTALLVIVAMAVMTMMIIAPRGQACAGAVLSRPSLSGKRRDQAGRNAHGVGR